MLIHNFLLSLGICAVPAVLNGVSVVAWKKGEVMSQPKSLADAQVLGENILRVLKKTNGAACCGELQFYLKGVLLTPIEVLLRECVFS